jgi:secondary thiamine-phosphate synthase enzyme
MRRQAERENATAIAQEQPGTPRIPKVFSSEISIATKGDTDMLDITAHLERLVHDSGVQDGLACLFVGGSTGALTTMEFEPGVVEDLRAALQRIVPSGIEYQHHLKWKDGNGHSHVRAAIIGPSITIPIREGQLSLGTWQQVVFIELDVRPRKRDLIVQIFGTA